MDKLRIEKVKSIKERLDAIFDELSELQKAEQEDYTKMPKWQKRRKVAQKMSRCSKMRRWRSVCAMTQMS